MASDYKKTITLPSGDTYEGIPIKVNETVDRFTDIKLEDGTELRAKLNITEAIRVDGHDDRDGNPLYFINSQTTVTLVKKPLKNKKDD